MLAKWLWGGTSTFTEKLRSKYCSCAQQWTYNGLTDGTGRIGQPKLGHQPITPGWSKNRNLSRCWRNIAISLMMRVCGRCAGGGRYASRTGAEDCVGLGGVVIFGSIYPVIGGLLDPANSDTGDTMMMGLYVALGIFLLIAVRKPSEHRSLVELRSRGGDVRAGIGNGERTHRVSGRLCRAGRDWRSPHPAGSERAVRTAGSRCVTVETSQFYSQSRF